MIKQPGELNMVGTMSEQTAKKLNLDGSDWASLGGDVLGGLGSYLSSSNNASAEKAKADAAVQIAQLQLQQSQQNAAAAAAAAAAANGTQPGLSTGAILGIVGAAVVLIGVVIVIAVKK